VMPINANAGNRPVQRQAKEHAHAA
jgi:hypothetical protein